MTSLKTGSRRVAALAALLGAATLLAVSAAPAAATYGKCDRGDFCLFYDGFENHGIYHFAGDDPNLLNDRFEAYNTDEIVGNNTLRAWNNGYAGALGDVLIYTMTGYRGARDCIRTGDRGNLPENWWNSIESYRWVSRSVCNANGVIDLQLP